MEGAGGVIFIVVGARNMDILKTSREDGLKVFGALSVKGEMKMANPVYQCPHCKGNVQIDLTGKGLILLLKKEK